MLSFRDVSLRRGTQILFSDVSFTIHAGQKVGLTGPNGAGKSSLFALIRGEIACDRGTVSVPSGITLAHVAQETPDDPRSALDYVLDGDRELRTLEAAIAAEETRGGAALGELHLRMAAIGGYAAPARAAKLLTGLGFAAGEEDRPVRSFSGGWRMRLNLARTLMCRSDLLLLDEPTNHLDLDAVIWLEQWLSGYSGTLLLISHDRDFLDRTVDAIAHLEHGEIRLYTGNYSAFERARAARLAGQRAAYEKQQREIAHVRAFVARFRYQASKARQAQSRLKALERLEQVAAAHVATPFTFTFRPPRKLPQPLLVLDGVAVGYDGHSVLDGVNLTIGAGDRIALLGRNGAGKSTLIKLLAGALVPQRGERRGARELAVGYFAQHQLEQLEPEATALAHLQRIDPDGREQDQRNFLGSFNFDGDRIARPVGSLSGGEKARLALALLLHARPNLLLLDEPTNHLDLDMRQALTRALQDYVGALVVVAHDRHLLRLTVDRLLLVADGKLVPWDGDLDDYARWLVDERRVAEGPGPEATPERHGDKQRRQRAARLRERLRPLRDAVRAAERTLSELERRRDELASLLADPALYAAPKKDELTHALRTKAEIDRAYSAAEAAWLEHADALERAERETAE